MSTPQLGQPLNPAEAAVLRYLTEGYSIAEVARRQGTRAAAVHSRAARARRKLGARTNDHAVQLHAEQQAAHAATSPAPTEQAPLENTVPDPTALDHAEALIQNAWDRPIAELEKAAIRRPVDDPLLHAAMHTRSHLTVISHAVAVHQDRLHALTRPGHVPAFHDLDRITETASALRTAYAESNTALTAIRDLVDAREHTLKAEGGRDAERVRAATARTAPSRPLGLIAHRPAQAASVAGSPAPVSRRQATGQSATGPWQSPESAAPTARASSSSVSSTR
ncbi:sigma factor-like helix-turn-helix DNA-binding protein [Kitasatospora purpeofusca]|uniref:sigma factor-like helix-turn-helix DNA-binding protein n=1 Tax=Kitasatospora purpeofusca TaxID=67352 RepID=UPI0035D72A89